MKPAYCAASAARTPKERLTGMVPVTSLGLERGNQETAMPGNRGLIRLALRAL